MQNPSRLFRRIAGAAIIIAIALFLVLLIAPWFIKTAPIENKIRDVVAQHTGDAVTFQHVDLSLLPRPSFIVRAAVISFRGIVTGKLESVHVYPELLPLFLGRIHIAKVRLEKPDLVLEFSEDREETQEQKGPMSLEEQRTRIASVIASIRTVAPELVALVNEGRLSVAIDNKKVLSVSGLDARLALPPNGFDIAITGNFARWGAVSAGGRFLSTGGNSLEINGLSLAGGRSSLSDLSGRISWEKTPLLELSSGRSVIFLQDLSERLSTFEPVRNALSSVRSLKGTINLASFSFAGPLLHPGQGTMKASGSVANILVDAVTLPGPIKVNSSTFKATLDSISVTDARTELLDASFITSVSLSGPIHDVHAIDVSLDGNSGPETIRWASTMFNLPAELTLRAPLSLSKTRFRWQKDGNISLRGALQVLNGPLVSMDLQWEERELLIRRLDIQDKESRASLTLHRRDNLLDVTFAGNIYEQSLQSLFEQSSFRHGEIQGNLKAHVVLDHAQGSTADGEISGKELLVPLIFRSPLNIENIHLSARDKIITIESSELELADHHFTVAGTIKASADRFIVDGDVEASAVSIDALRKALGKDADQEGPEAKPDNAQQKKPFPLEGTLRCKADSLSFGRFVLNPVQATVFLAPDELRVDNFEAVFCGITVRGGLSLAGGDSRVDIKPEANGLQLEPALACLAGKDQKISGVFDLSGSLSARGKPDELVSSLQGSAEFTARDGHIYHQIMLAKIFSVTKVQDLLQGKGPDVRTKGLAYRSISIKASLRSRELALEEVIVDSSAMNIVGQGGIDLNDSTIRMTVLVAPFTNVDQIVGKIPVVNYILQGTLVSIPVSVNGRINDPEVNLMPASAVGDGLSGILKRTLKAPVKIIEPVLPEKREKEAGSQ